MRISDLAAFPDARLQVVQQIVERDVVQGKVDDQVVWYHEGPPELERLRTYLADFSLPRHVQRVAMIWAGRCLLLGMAHQV